MPKFIAALAVFLALPAGASAESTSHWVRIQSNHFTVITDSSDQHARHIAGQFESMRALFHELFPSLASDSGSRTVVFACRDSKCLTSIEPSNFLAKGSMTPAGFFLRTTDQNYIVIDLGAPNDPYTLVYHEYTHFLLRKAAWLPLWLNEGLAEFYSHTEMDGQNIRLGEPSPSQIKYLRNNSLIPLPKLFAADSSSSYYNESDKTSIFYAESWALTYFIRHSDFDNKTYRFQDYVDLLQQHQDPLTAAQTVFGNLNELEYALSAYINQTSFKFFSVKRSFNINEKSFESIPISAPGVNAIRAGILIAGWRRKNGRELLEKVLKEEPGNVLALENEGLFMRNFSDKVALEWFAKAARLDPQSYIANYYFAVLSIQARVTGSDDAIEASLLFAIKDVPDSAPAYDALGHFYATHNEKLSEAHMMYAHAVQLEPEEVAYRINAADVEIKRQNIPSAIKILEGAKMVARTPADTATVQSRLTQLKNILQHEGSH